MQQLPIYKIKGKFYFLDKRLLEYRNTKNPADVISFKDVDLSQLQKPTQDDIKEVVEGLNLSLKQVKPTEEYKQPYGFHIVIEGHDEQQMIDLFEEIQNNYNFYDNCVIEEINKEDTIIDDDRQEETGHLITKKN